MSASLDDIARDPAAAAQLGRDGVAAALVRVGAVQSALAARLVALGEVPAARANAPDKNDRVGLLDVEAVRTLLGLSNRRAVYSLARRADFANVVVRVSRRALQFDERALRAWIERRRGRAA